MNKALYRNYRPKSFDEVIGQDHITKTLSAAVKAGRISHAYLFTGPKGLGKTSVARILAHEINGLPYEDESPHLDIIEIDAASNRRIEEIRDLRDKVHLAPTSAKYKVYIIDEVHMLTRDASNALLKTLEEPPQHVIFILATTEAHKLLETIISRTQRHTFKPVATATVAKHLADIAKKEGIKIDGPALELLARYGEGSFRDSIGLLDQLGSAGLPIDEAMVREHLGLPRQELVDQLLLASLGGQPAQVLKLLEELNAQAADPAGTAKLLSRDIRQKLSNGEPADNQRLFELLKELANVSYSLNPSEQLELALLAVSASGSPAPLADQRQSSAPKPPQHNDKPNQSETPPKAEPKAKNLPAESQAKAVGGLKTAEWDKVLASVKQTAPSLYTALRLAKPQLSAGRLTLAFEFPLHQKKLELTKNKDVVARALESITGQRLEITCQVDKELFKAERPEPQAAPEPAPEPEGLGAIASIFGTAEVLES